MKHDVFISHSTVDDALAKQVCAVLEGKGVPCWLGQRDIMPGKNWGESIMEALDACRTVVLILTSKAIGSQHVVREIERAVDRRLPIVPFRVEDVKLRGALEYFLSTEQFVDAVTPPVEDHIESLASAVQAQLRISESAFGTVTVGGSKAPESAFEAETESTAVEIRVRSMDDSGENNTHVARATDKIILGRSSKVSLCVTGPGVSRAHACISFAEDAGQLAPWLVDLQSKNGTRVNDELIKGHRRLAVGDVITLGQTRLEFTGFEVLPGDQSSAPAG